MNEQQKRREPDMEALREAVAEELRTMKTAEIETEAAAEQTPPLAGEESSAGRLSFFRRAETLAQLVEDFGELRETVAGLERELERQRRVFDAERERAGEAETALRRENEALRRELRELREAEELIHMRVFDNRVRISEVKEALEDAEKRALSGEREAKA